jgi:8-hydroxy-5-deazaflavin:NADPH oxidoreductase
MNIGIVGSGEVGKTLARGFAERGHPVVLGTRHVAEHQDLAPLVEVASFDKAAAHGEVVVLAVRWAAVGEVLGSISAAALNGKILVDATNPLTYRDGRPTGIEVPLEGSAAQRIAALAAGARIVKGFNTVGAGLMVAPQIAGGPPDMFICGDDEDAKRVVASLCDELAYPPFDVGPLALAAQLEQLGMLWIAIAMGGRAKGHAFKLLR